MNELKIIPPKEITPPSGFRVKIVNQQRIFSSIPAVTRNEPPTTTIQYNQIEDAVCGSVFTVMRCYDHQSSYNPGTYEFDAEVDFEGKRLSALSARRGYFDQTQIKKIIAALEAKGYKGDYEDSISVTSDENLQRIGIRDHEGRKYRIRMGFPSPQAHREWIDKQVAGEKEEKITGYYTVFGQGLKSNLHNDNLQFYSQPFNYPEDLKETEAFAFSRNLVGFARAYEDFLNALYASIPVTPPNRVLNV